MEVFIVILILVFILVVPNIKVVPQAKVYVIERLGSYYKTWYNGLHVKIPFVDRVANVVTLKEIVKDFPPQPVITKDNVTMQIDTVVYFQITDAKLYSYGVENPINAIENLTATTLRNLIGELELDQTLTSRDIINTKMRSILDEATDPWGIKINRVEVKNIIPPRDIQEAMEKQMRAERERREKILQAEGERDARIARAEGEAREIFLKKKAEADGYKALIEAGITPEVLELKRYETLMKVADGQASKVIIPTDVVESTRKNVLFSETTGLGETTPQGSHIEAKPEEDPCCERFEKKK